MANCCRVAWDFKIDLNSRQLSSDMSIRWRNFILRTTKVRPNTSCSFPGLHILGGRLYGVGSSRPYISKFCKILLERHSTQLGLFHVRLSPFYLNSLTGVVPNEDMIVVEGF